jgi:type IV pilus assembly protein PilW
MDATFRPIPAARRHQAGFSLVELMVALALGLLILVGLSTLFANTSVARGEIDKASRQIENGRFALQTLADDIRHAGYYGALAFAPAAPAAMPDPCSTVTADVQAAIGLPLQGYAGAAAAPLACLDGYKPQTGVIVVRRASTAAPAASAVAGSFNIQVSGCAGDGNVGYVLDTSAGTFGMHSNGSPGCVPLTGAPIAPISPFFVRIYYVSCNSDSATACGASGGDGVPTLQRLEVYPANTPCPSGSHGVGAGNTSPCIAPVVDGIENLQFGYGLDSSSPTPDGTPDVYTDVPPASVDRAASGAYVNNWRDVMSVRIYLMARNLDPTGGYVDAKTYALGPVSVNYAANDPLARYKRHAYSEVVRLNNPAGRRE